MAVTYQTIQTDVLSVAKIGVVTLRREAVKNALSEHMLRELAAAFDVLEARTDVHAIVVTGGPSVFAAGMDIHDMEHRLSRGEPALSVVMEEAWARIEGCKLPVIAAVCGAALGGGCELMMLCDIVVASETAQFGQPEVFLGLMPGAGGTQRLTRRIGLPLAMDMCLTGRRLTAQEALGYGLISRLTSPDQVLPLSLSLAQHLGTMSRPAVQAIKQAVRLAQERTLSEGLASERAAFRMLAALDDSREGLHAFLNKRPPRFHHDRAPRRQTGGNPRGV